MLAHVPDLNDFVAGMKIALKPTGVITMEFPHLMRLMEGNQFDTIYHEHFSYFSFLTAEQVFAAHGLTVFDVEGDSHPRRLAADLRAARRGRVAAGRRQPSPNCGRVKSAPDSTGSRPTARSTSR